MDDGGVEEDGRGLGGLDGLGACGSIGKSTRAKSLVEIALSDSGKAVGLKTFSASRTAGDFGGTEEGS